MRQSLALVALLLPLGGCVVPPGQPVPYGYGGYPQPGYPQAVYPGVAEYGYPGFAYNDGSPTLFSEGVNWPLIFYGGGWGYWDGGHRWHRAPEGIERHLDQRHPNGFGYRPWGGGQFGRPEGPRFDRPGGPWGGGRPPGVAAGGPPGGLFGPGGWHPGSPGPGFHPGGPPPGPGPAFHPGGPPPGPPPASHPGLFQPGGFRPAAAPQVAAGPPPGGHPSGQRRREDERH
jgi:hypothetical protein